MTNYLYIDDQPDKASGIATGLSITENLKVTLSPATTWSDQIKAIQKERLSYDGLLLDLQLRIPQETLMYDAPALAQQIRNLAKEGKIIDLPIILCTTDELFLQMYDKNTNDDLFDRIYYKDQWTPKVNEQDFREFISLANGYKDIVESDKNLIAVINAPNEQVIIQIMDKISDTSTVHGLSNFILKQLILVPGLLVDESLLAIRLGVDIEQSSDWSDLKGKLQQFSYTGIFKEAWPRWWMGEIMRFWRGLSGGLTLRNMPAKQKVEILQKEFNLNNLTAIQVPNHHTQETFWYKCALSSTPLSSDDGLQIKGQDRKFDWQDRDYISKYHLWTIDSTRDEQVALSKVSYSDVENVKAIFNQKRQS